MYIKRKKTVYVDLNGLGYIDFDFEVSMKIAFRFNKTIDLTRSMVWLKVSNGRQWPCHVHKVQSIVCCHGLILSTDKIRR